jgi:hypothetical protein
MRLVARTLSYQYRIMRPPVVTYTLGLLYPDEEEE